VAESDERFAVWASDRIAGLHRTAYLLCGDWHTAEDCVQEALARVAVRWTRIERVDNPDAYVRRVLVNTVRERRRRRSAGELPTDQFHDLAVADGSQARADRDELLAALRELPRRQRAAVVLRYFDGLTEAETAAVLSCSVGTVKSQTSRALDKLRLVLTREASSC
jgi:RNA polymerase sigma-70 factor (sigma-E family)